MSGLYQVDGRTRMYLEYIGTWEGKRYFPPRNIQIYSDDVSHVVIRREWVAALRSMFQPEIVRE